MGVVDAKGGALSLRHSTARKRHYCDDCERPILVGQTYWRRYGRADVGDPFWMLRTCERCEAQWREMVGLTA